MAGKALIITENQDLAHQIKNVPSIQNYDFYHGATFLDGLDYLVSKTDFKITYIQLSSPWESSIQSLYPIRWISDTYLVAMLYGGGTRDKAHILDIADDCILLPAEADRIASIEIQASNRRCSTLLSHSKKAYFYNRGLMVFPMSFRMFFGDIELHPTRIEYDILFYLIRNRDSIISRDQILEAVWRHRYSNENDKTVSVHMTSIRTMLSAVTDEVFIETVRGFGYRFITERPWPKDNSGSGDRRTKNLS